VLLAALPAREREAYVASGPFPALTARTITDPAALRAELEKVREQGYAVDDEEIAAGLHCIAVPVRAPDGRVLAAISASGVSKLAGEPGGRILERLTGGAATIEAIAARLVAID
jgi:DNA-binding IclR family transcriptional regulator